MKVETLGIYLHIPFCKRKCSYCDFYSLSDISLIDNYVNALIKAIEFYKDKNKTVDTIYLGGGTPSLLTPMQIGRIIESLNNNFNVVSPETTIEANPCTVDEEYFYQILKNGINRLSIGVQSLNDNELIELGRLHDFKSAINAIKSAQNAGFTNISADLMIGTPYQTATSLCNSIENLVNLNIKHVSSYMLKIEKGTPFYNNYSNLNLPDEDETADSYLLAVEKLDKFGFKQYEISNFAIDGYQSRHNLKYWQLKDYLGLGPASHSFYNGKRFYFKRDIFSFISMADKNLFTPSEDEKVNIKEEYIMLSLRLSKGLSLSHAKKLGIDIDGLIKKATMFINSGFMVLNGDQLYFTKEGFLVSNIILSRII